jgi:large subunit ribosomal protein L32e
MRNTRLPKFVRQNKAQKKRVGDAWRKPRGIDNKQRVQLGGTGRLPKIGFRTPKSTRFLSNGGKIVVLVHNAKELAAVAPEHLVRFGGTMGGRLREKLLKVAASRKLRVVNG